jgi:hypothetical protein
VTRTAVRKCDVRKFFESINHEILCERLFKAVHCPGVRRVMRRIVNSHATAPHPNPLPKGAREQEAVPLPLGERLYFGSSGFVIF